MPVTNCLGRKTPGMLQGVCWARQALKLSFNDVFRLMSLLFAAALVMFPSCRPAPAAVPAPDAH